MAKRIDVCQGGLNAVFEIGDGREVSLLHFFHEAHLLNGQWHLGHQ